MEKLRSIWLATFLCLVVTIIFTPLMIRRGFPMLDVELLESSLLFVQVSIAWVVFRQYEAMVRKGEAKTRKLEIECKRREKELLDAFKYLGKINVQMSLAKSFLQNLKTPTSRKEVKKYIDEITSLTLSISKKKWVLLRVIGLEDSQTVAEYWSREDPDVEVNGIKISNKDILVASKGKSNKELEHYLFYASKGSELSPYKVFLIFPNKGLIDDEVRDFLIAAANQCEMIYTLYAVRSNSSVPKKT